MEYPLHFNRQTWKPKHDGQLTIFLPSSERWGLSFNAMFEFVPPWLEDEDFQSEHRTMRVDVNGYIPRLKDWRELEGMVLGASAEDDDDAEDDEEKMGTGWGLDKEPEIEIWSSSKGVASIHTHAKDGWETRLKLEAMAEDEPYTFVCEVEAFFPSERARKASSELFFKQFFGGLDFSDEEKAKLLEEGWRFRYRGRLRLDELSCIVPLNTKDAVGWAKGMAGQELKMSQFGFCRVNGGEMDGSFKPEQGIVSNGRLVLLSPPTDYFYQWQQWQADLKRKRDEGQAGK